MSRELYVDGHSHENGGVFSGDGKYPPFVVFDADKQENIAGPFNTRKEAETHLQEILAGAEPKLDASALGDWIERIDNAVYNECPKCESVPCICRYKCKKCDKYMCETHVPPEADEDAIADRVLEDLHDHGRYDEPW